MQLNEVKSVIVNKTPVICNGIEYTVYACRLRLQNHKWVYDLELIDENKNCIVIADMEGVKIK